MRLKNEKNKHIMWRGMTVAETVSRDEERREERAIEEFVVTD